MALLTALHWVLTSSPWPSTSREALFWLGLSGIAGLTLGDSLYFHACAVLGPRLGTLLMATAPAQTVALAWPILGERLQPSQLLGVAATLAGLGLVLLGRRTDEAWTPSPGRSRRVALLAGLLAATGQALGYVLTRLGMTTATAAGLPVEPLSAGLVRLTVALPFALALSGRRGFGPTRRAFADRRAMGLCALGAVLGPVLGVWCAMTALARTDTGVAATLLALNPLLMLPIARWTYGARVTATALWGTLLAVAGAAHLCWQRD